MRKKLRSSSSVLNPEAWVHLDWAFSRFPVDFDGLGFATVGPTKTRTLDPKTSISGSC